jgi:hypothetical protein
MVESNQADPKELSGHDVILEYMSNRNEDGSITKTTNSKIIEQVNQLNSNTNLSGHVWNLEGTVQYVGKPCPPNSKFFTVPPCSGPYPNYEVIIYDEDGKRVISKIKTDSNGNFKAFLEPGSYLIHTRAGLSPSNIKATHFTIQPSKNTNLGSLFVDTGLE